MPAMDNPSATPRFSRSARLRNGTPVLIRAIRGDDRGRIITAFHKLEPKTIYTRFFSAKRELTDADLSRIDASDFEHAAVLVATLGTGADEVIIGGGAYTVLERPGEPRTAELSFTVEEDYQGQGLSTLFMALLTEIGRERGIECFEAEVLAGNAPMLRVFERCGLPQTRRREGAVVHVRMSLAPPQPPGPAGA